MSFFRKINDQLSDLDPTRHIPEITNKLSDLDPTRYIPGSKEIAEQLWGEAGAIAYQAAAQIMRERNGGGQGLDETQKNFLRQQFSGLVDHVSVAYNSKMMDQWEALGICIHDAGTSGQTYGDRIYLRDPYSPDDSNQLILLADELRHSQQCRELGGLGKFGFHYFREFKRAGQNYENNSMEVEAREAENLARRLIST